MYIPMCFEKIPVEFVDSWRSSTGKPTIVFDRYYGRDLADHAVNLEKVMEKPSYDYIFAKKLAKYYTKCIHELLKRNPRDVILQQLVKLNGIKVPMFLWESKNHLVINPFYVLKKLAPLASVLDPGEFAEVFRQVSEYLIKNVEWMAVQENSRLEANNVCHPGMGSTWCEEAIDIVAEKIDRYLDRIVEQPLRYTLTA